MKRIRCSSKNSLNLDSVFIHSSLPLHVDVHMWTHPKAFFEITDSFHFCRENSIFSFSPQWVFNSSFAFLAFFWHFHILIILCNCLIIFSLCWEKACFYFKMGALLLDVVEYKNCIYCSCWHVWTLWFLPFHLNNIFAAVITHCYLDSSVFFFWITFFTDSRYEIKKVEFPRCWSR